MSLVAAGAPRPAPKTIEALAGARGQTRLRDAGPQPDGGHFTARLVTYQAGPLTMHALVATPRTPPPPGGFPVVVANHGTHPDPPRYGIGANGVNARPGDYYRQVPELYARRGFMVVMPDYRGHNTSEGVESARGFLASAYYSEDVIALLGGLGDLPQANAEAVVMWGHSLGAEVTLRALLAAPWVRAAALWSTVGGDVWEQAHYYARSKARDAFDADHVVKAPLETLRADIAALGEPYDWRAREPWLHLHRLKTPVILHHALGDTGAKYEWSERLAAALAARGHRYEFHTYPGSDHFLTGAARELAADRDAAFFNAAIAAPRR
jgi:dipeptidyl aminopeptidase/acylaminoacyl peptidase